MAIWTRLDAMLNGDEFIKIKECKFFYIIYEFIEVYGSCQGPRLRTFCEY